MKLKVKFSIEPQYTSKSHKDKCLSLYGDKFSALVRESKSKKYFASDYDSLSQIRKLLTQHNSITDLIPVINGKISEANILRLTQVAPMFDAAALDLRAYILMSLGLRTYCKDAYEKTTS